MKLLYLISRIGGLDGTALQYNNYVKMFRKVFGISVYTITGKINEEFGPFRERENMILFPELSVEDETRNFLYANSFKGKFSRDSWFPVFEKSMESIYDMLKKTISEISPEIVVMHNLFSFAHFHIAAGVALRRIVREFPGIKFVSMAPDSDFERKERLGMMEEEIVGLLSSNKKLPGPVYAENIYHVVLNSSQMRQFVEDYNIPESHVFKVPDFEDFYTMYRLEFRKDFMPLLEKNHLSFIDGAIKYTEKKCSEDDFYILFAVRPVERKKIIPSMLIAKLLLSDKINGRMLKFVITHPDREENGDYMQKIAAFAESEKLDLIYLGERIKLRKQEDSDFTLDEVYFHLSKMKTVGFVGSSAGGWENVTVELSKHSIPVFVNPELPSFKDMVSLGLDFKELPISEVKDIDTGNKKDLSAILRNPRVSSFKKEFIKIITNPDYKAKIVSNNFAVSESKLSLNSAASKWNAIFERIK